MSGFDGYAQRNKNTERDNQKIDDSLDERTAVHHNGLAVIGRGSQRPDNVGKISLAERQGNERRDDVRDE